MRKQGSLLVALIAACAALFAACTPAPVPTTTTTVAPTTTTTVPACEQSAGPPVIFRNCEAPLGYFRRDLSFADLSGSNLFGADLSGVNMTNANLSGVNLAAGNVSGVNMTNANLSGANLTGQTPTLRVGVFPFPGMPHHKVLAAQKPCDFSSKRLADRRKRALCLVRGNNASRNSKECALCPNTQTKKR